MKKLLSIFLITAMLLGSFAVNSFAAEEPIILEVEDADSADGSFSIVEDSNCSGGKYFRYYTTPSSNFKYLIELSFVVEKKGTYELSGNGSIRGQSYTSDWNVYIDSESNSVSTYTQTASVDSVIKTYSMDRFVLDKGAHTLYVQMNTSDVQEAKQIVAYLDCFMLKRAASGSFALDKVCLGGSEIGVYSEDENVKLDFTFTDISTKEENYRFEIVDFWQRDVLSGNVVIPKGIYTYSAVMGKFDIGWYRVYIYENGQTDPINKYLAFSVTVSPSKRSELTDNSVASDMAGEDVGKTRKLVKDFDKALKLAGIDWIRERDYAKNTPGNLLDYKAEVDKDGINAISVSHRDGMRSTSADDAFFITDLYENAYKHYKSAAETLTSADMLEVYNELDIYSSPTGTGDGYASYFKAAAIGISDSKNKPYKAMTGLANRTNKFIDLILQSDILNYSDIYNFHAHGEVAARSKQGKYNVNAYAPDSATPSWCGEAGIHQVLDSSGILSDSQMRVAARYAITSAVTSISNGTDKHFWFLMRPFIENNGNYSAFHTDYMPYPMYSSLSNLTYQIGEGTYKGDIAGLPDGTTGYMFDDGRGNDVAVMWTEGANNYVYLEADKVYYSDIVGYEETKTADAGKIKISVSQDPVFIRFDGRSSEKNYYAAGFERNLDNRSFEPHERIVLQQLWDNQNYKNAKLAGYEIELNSEFDVRMVVYNLNDEPMSGTVAAVTGDFLVADTAEQTFSCEPWGKTELIFRLRTTDKAYASGEGNVKFYGKTSDGKEISPTVSYYKIKLENRTIDPENYVVFENFWKPERWDLSNIASNGKNTFTYSEEEKTCSFKNTFTGDRWSFPYFAIPDASILAGSQGLVFERICEPGYASEKTSVFVYMKDGRNYYSGDANAVAYSDEKMQLIFPWTMFSLYSSPLGGVDIREFKLEDISMVSIGISGGPANQAKYTISNFGYFYSDLPSEQLDSQPVMSFSGMEHGKIYTQSESKVLLAEFKDSNIYNPKVHIGNTLYDNWTYEDGKMTIDFNGVPRGKYHITVSAQNEMNYAYIGSFEFYVE